MATTGFDLTKGSWTDLGTTPCFMQSAGGDPAAIVLFVVATTVPASLDVPAHRLRRGSDLSANVSLPNQRVYARAETGAPASVVVSR